MENGFFGSATCCGLNGKGAIRNVAAAGNRELRAGLLQATNPQGRLGRSQ